MIYFPDIFLTENQPDRTDTTNHFLRANFHSDPSMTSGCCSRSRENQVNPGHLRSWGREVRKTSKEPIDLTAICYWFAINNHPITSLFYWSVRKLPASNFMEYYIRYLWNLTTSYDDCYFSIRKDEWHSSYIAVAPMTGLSEDSEGQPTVKVILSMDTGMTLHQLDTKQDKWLSRFP